LKQFTDDMLTFPVLSVLYLCHDATYCYSE